MLERFEVFLVGIAATGQEQDRSARTGFVAGPVDAPQPITVGSDPVRFACRGRNFPAIDGLSNVSTSFGLVLLLRRDGRLRWLPFGKHVPVARSQRTILGDEMHAIFTYVLLGALAIALLVAVVTDLRSRTIGNRLNAGIALAAPLFWWASELALWPGVAIQLGIAALTFAICCLFFAIRQMGGGDVKLLTALALWMPPAAFLDLLVIMVLVGWVLTLVMGIWQVARSGSAEVTPRRDLGVLIGCTLIAAAFASAVLGGPTVAMPPALAEFASGDLAVTLVLAMLPVLLLAAVTLASLRVLRRQDEQIRVPYGLAIATGGIWILATGDLVSAMPTAALG
ncbi:prepilin peptidase [Erythrobacter sp. QSSC1-22B]|uniref:A24 family peptidase n=1 Tax=Erythrobacter sp. QSSC1-22B TaxID=1860125 RepID=UPI00351231D5